MSWETAPHRGRPWGVPLFVKGTITFENTKSILFSGNTTGHSPTSAHANIGGAIYAGANDSSSSNMKTYIPEGEDAITFRGIGGDIIFEDNSAWMAGAIYAYAGTVDGQEGTRRRHDDKRRHRRRYFQEQPGGRR